MKSDRLDQISFYSSDFASALLKFVMEIEAPEAMIQLSHHYKIFKFSTPNEKTNVTLLKSEILEKLATHSSDKEIRQEIVTYLLHQLEQHNFVIKSAILKSLCKLSIAGESVTDSLLDVLKTNPEEMTPVFLKNVKLLPEKVLPDLSIYSITHSVDLQEDFYPILWSLNNHVSSIPKSPYILEKLLDLSSDDCQRQFLDFLLITGIKVFLKYPPESQHVLGRIFDLCHKENSAGMSAKLQFYSKVLHNEHEALERIIFQK